MKETFDDDVPVWSLSERGKGNDLKLLSSNPNLFLIPNLFVPELRESNVEWEIKIGSIVSVGFKPSFKGTLTRDQTIGFHLEFDTRIEIRNS